MRLRKFQEIIVGIFLRRQDTDELAWTAASSSFLFGEGRLYVTWQCALNQTRPTPPPSPTSAVMVANWVMIISFAYLNHLPPDSGAKSRIDNYKLGKIEKQTEQE